MKNRIWTLTLAFVGIIMFMNCDSSAQDNTVAKDISQNELQSILDNKNPVLLDVRTPEEYADGHMEGSVNINISSDDFIQNLESLDKEKPILIYCAAGARSHRAMGIMKAQGFKELYNLEGGYSEYLERNPDDK